MEPLDDLDTETVLACAEANLRTERRAGFERLQLAYRWARLHTERSFTDGRVRTFTHLGAEQLPVYEYAAAELGISLEIHPLAAQHLMADAIDLAERLPHTWAALAALRLEAWVGRKIAKATRDLEADQARGVDAALADSLGALATGRLLTLVEARVVEADTAAADARAQKARNARFVHLSRDTHDETGLRTLTGRLEAADALRLSGTINHLAHLLADAGTETLDQLRARALGILANPMLALQLILGTTQADATEEPPSTSWERTAWERLTRAILDAPAAKVRPRTVLYVHTTPAQLATGAGVARAEDLGALTRTQLTRLLGHEHITLRPVIDLADRIAADCYETPANIAERLHLTKPGDIFPHATSLSRTQDTDHTMPYDPHGPPGQTRSANLGFMVRRHHRIKTHAHGWTLQQPRDGTYIWTTPHGRKILVDHTGTHQLIPTRPTRLSALEARLEALLLAS